MHRKNVDSNSIEQQAAAASLALGVLRWYIGGTLQNQLPNVLLAKRTRRMFSEPRIDAVAVESVQTGQKANVFIGHKVAQTYCTGCSFRAGIRARRRERRFARDFVSERRQDSRVDRRRYRRRRWHCEIADHHNRRSMHALDRDLDPSNRGRGRHVLGDFLVHDLRIRLRMPLTNRDLLVCKFSFRTAPNRIAVGERSRNGGRRVASFIARISPAPNS